MKYSLNVAMLILWATSFQAWGQSTDRAQILTEIRALRSQLGTHEVQFLAPAPSDFQAYADFLRQPDTGLVRLLPREVFDNPQLLTIRGGGAYYSFTRLTHDYGYGSDVELSHGNFSVGFAGANYGLFAMLEDTPVDTVTLNHPAVQYLATLKPATTLPEARTEQQRAGEGVRVDGFQYINRATALVGRTYVVRSINYSQSDVLVGFQVVRRDEDGSLVLAWKLLKAFDVPGLQR